MGHKKWYAVHSASGAHIGLWSDMDMARGVRDNEYPDGTITELVEDGRPCTCHPDDNPPNPCAEKYALTECVNSHASLVEENKRMRKVLSYLYGHLDLLIGSVRHAAKTDHRWEGMDEIVVKWRSEISEALGDTNA